jgi:hypothetical protein
MHQNLVEIPPEKYQQYGFRQYVDFGFSADETEVEIVSDELGHVLTTFPIAVVDLDQQPRLVALLSVVPKRNLYLLPEGHWLGYQPALIRCFPFAPAPNDSASRHTLYVEASHLTTWGEGMPILDVDGSLTPAVHQIQSVLASFVASRQRTRRGVCQLRDVGLLMPWHIKVRQEDGTEEAVDGLWRVNESALQQLDPQHLGQLATSGALALAYAQLFSLSRMETLQRAASKFATFQQEQERLPVVDSPVFHEGDESVRFDY